MLTKLMYIEALGFELYVEWDKTTSGTFIDTRPGNLWIGKLHFVLSTPWEVSRRA